MSDDTQPGHDFWSELRRHPAFQTAIVFAGASWLALQAADIFGLSTGIVRAVGGILVGIFVLLVGFSLIAVLRGGRSEAVVPRARTRAIALATVTLLVLGTGAWFARPYVVAPLRAGAEVIAVLPFAATGTGVEVLGEGLVDLLSTNLNEVGVIRTINPRTMLHEFNEATRDGGLDLTGQLRVGERVGAGSVLVGSLVSTGTEVRITAELYSVETGAVIAKAQENGRPDSVLALVDQLSIELMQDIWRSRAPLPELRVSAITTQSVPAIRAYLRGEQFYRRVQWDSAMASFNEAISHDSTFALAHFRLGETYGWSESLGSADARRHSDAAARFAERLPARERALIVAHQLHEQGDVAAIDSLTAYVSRFPDDVGGHFLLADARMHAGATLGLGLRDMLSGFERVYGMDSTFAPNFAHLLELTALSADTAGYGRYLAAYRRVLPVEADLYAAVRDIRWGERNSALAAAGVTLRGSGSLETRRITRVMVSVSQRAFANGDIDFALAAVDTLAMIGRDMPQIAVQRIQSRAGLFAAAGRVREAESLIAEIRAENADQALNASLMPIITGLAPESAFKPERAILGSLAGRPTVAYWLAIEALLADDVAAAERHVAVLEGDTAQTGFLRPELIAALNGWVTAARGDTVGGAAQLRRSLLDLGYAPTVAGPAGPLRAQLAVLQTARAETRAEGIRRLELMMLQEGGTIGYVAVPLAEAYLAEGRIDDARAMYARLLGLWENADPELGSRVRAVADALTRITGERAATD